MEKLKVKHDHKLTDIIKVGIFGLMLLMPFLTWLPTCMYYGLNKYVQINEEKEIVDFNQQVSPSSAMDWLTYDNGTYTYTYSGIQSLSTVQTQFKEPFTFVNGHKYINYRHVDDTPYFMIWDVDRQNYITWDNNTIYTSDNNDTVDLNMIFSDFTGTINFYFCVFDLTQMFGAGNEPTVSQFNDYFPIKAYEYTLSKEINLKLETTIDSKITDAWSNLWQTPLFNWTNKSILKTGLNAFCGVFGIVDKSYITNFLTYELVIVSIYIILDIVIEIFKWLTHLIGEK